MEKETKTIIRAKKEGIDFENPEAMAQKQKDEEYKEQYDALQKKLDILESSILSQNRKFKLKSKQQKTKLNAMKDRQQELEHAIALQEAQVEEKKRTLQIYIDQKEARKQILKKRERERERAEPKTPASSIHYADFKS